MYGFTPKSNPAAQPAPFGARGVEQVRALIPTVQAMGYPQAAPASASNTERLKAMIPQMEAMGFQQQAAAQPTQYLANGGMIEGPGTGTSDSIPDEMEPGTYIMPADSTAQLGFGKAKRGKVPVRVSNGEFELPPEKVQAIGAAVLDAVKGVTHAPAQPRGFQPKGTEPEQFFADGGNVRRPGEPAAAGGEGGGMSKEAVMEAIRRQAGQSQEAPQQPKQGIAAMATDFLRNPGGILKDRERRAGLYADGGVVEDETKRLASPSNIYPGNRTQGSSGFSGAPVGQDAQVPAPTQVAPAGMPARNPGPSELYMNDRAQELRQQVGAGNYAQAAGTAARTAVQGLGMYGLEAADKVATPVINAAKGFGAGLFGSDAQAAPAPTPSAAAPAATPASRPVVPSAANPTDQRLAAGVQTGPTSTTTVAPVPTTADAATSGNQISPGVYQHGRGLYSDSADGMGFKPGFTGQPNAQNNAAAENLARGFNPGGAIAASAPAAQGGVTAPTVLHSGNSWQARNDLRNLEVAASSITNRPEWRSGSTTQAWSTRGPTGHPDPDGKIAAFQAASAADVANRAGQPAYDMKAAQENAATQREGIQQQGANQRTGMQEQGANARAGARDALASRELDLKGEAQGFQTRAARRQEKLQERYQNAKTDQERTAIAQEIRALAGKDGESPWKIQVTPAVKNADGSTSEGSIYRYNTQTGQVERADAGRGAESPYKEGQRLQGKDGKYYVVKNGAPVPER